MNVILIAQIVDNQVIWAIDSTDEGCTDVWAGAGRD